MRRIGNCGLHQQPGMQLRPSYDRRGQLRTHQTTTTVKARATTTRMATACATKWKSLAARHGCATPWPTPPTSLHLRVRTLRLCWQLHRRRRRRWRVRPAGNSRLHCLAAQNYNPLATDDDGSCTFSLEGCMDAEACNFNPIANTDTGGCVYAETHYDCNGNCLNDTDGDGVCDELETVVYRRNCLQLRRQRHRRGTAYAPTYWTAMVRASTTRMARAGATNWKGGSSSNPCKMVFGMSHQHGTVSAFQKAATQSQCTTILSWLLM